jgi:hypothetical protein
MNRYASTTHLLSPRHASNGPGGRLRSGKLAAWRSLIGAVLFAAAMTGPSDPLEYKRLPSW